MPCSFGALQVVSFDEAKALPVYDLERAFEMPQSMFNGLIVVLD